MQTFPENVQPQEKDPLVYRIFGNRFHADQTLYEYLIEFLLVFCSAKSESENSDEDGSFKFHDPDSSNQLSYYVEPRMGLKRFILFDKSVKTDSVAEIDFVAYRHLMKALADKIDSPSEDQKNIFLNELQDLFRGYIVVLKKRTWCAQAMLPICPELVFCEAMPNKKNRARLNWDEIINDPEGKKKIDWEFDFDKRNFLARGGELYYLHILQGLRKKTDSKSRLEFLLTDLIKVKGAKMSILANFIQKTWEGLVGYKNHKKRMNLAFIPESAYESVSVYTVDELINFLSCSMHPVKKIELLSKGVMMHVLRMLSVATSHHLEVDRKCWIIDMKGVTEHLVKKIASVSFRDFESCFDTVIGNLFTSNLEIGNVIKEQKKAKKDSMGIFRSKGKELQCIIPTSGPYERFSLHEDCIRFLVLALVKPGNKITLDMFLQKLFECYRIVIGPVEYKSIEPDDVSLANSFIENKKAFEDFLKATGFLQELSDSTSIVINPYDEIRS